MATSDFHQDATEPSSDVFRLTDLPTELREGIYFYASKPNQPIDTAAYSSSSDMVSVPAIAQLDKQIRKEALAVFYRDREIRISFHCMRDILRAIAWLDKAERTRALSNTISIEGPRHQRINLGRTEALTSLGDPRGDDSWYLKVHCSKEKPQFRVEIQPGSSKRIEKMLRRVKYQLDEYLGRRTDAKEGWHEAGKLRPCEMKSILNIVRGMTGYA